MLDYQERYHCNDLADLEAEVINRFPVRLPALMPKIHDAIVKYLDENYGIRRFTHNFGDSEYYTIQNDAAKWDTVATDIYVEDEELAVLLRLMFY